MMRTAILFAIWTALIAILCVLHNICEAIKNST